ncbi:MAG: restriction endonuclease subunit S [Euryarchaeota archaeon]|nr:restriction endonuclease subunit S [Euryarchaeota archaeon]
MLNKVATPEFSGISGSEVYPMLCARDVIMRDFLAYSLRTKRFLDYVKKHSKRSIIPKMNRKSLSSYILYVPELEEQQRIISILKKAMEKIENSVIQAELNLKKSQNLFESFLANTLDSFATSEPRHILSDLCELIVDCEHKTAPTQDTGYPSIRTPNVGMGDLLLDGVRRVSEETYVLWTRRAIPLPNDLILTREAPAGKVGVIPDGEMVCLGQRTVLLRPKREIFNSTFLAFLLHHPELQKKLLSHSTGATVAHVNMRDIRALGIGTIPAIDVQEEIVNQILIAKQNSEDYRVMIREKLDILIELRQSLLQEAFRGKLTGGIAA